jgi:hypothetical protein
VALTRQYRELEWRVAGCFPGRCWKYSCLQLCQFECRPDLQPAGRLRWRSACRAIYAGKWVARSRVWRLHAKKWVCFVKNGSVRHACGPLIGSSVLYGTPRVKWLTLCALRSWFRWPRGHGNTRKYGGEDAARVVVWLAGDENGRSPMNRLAARETYRGASGMLPAEEQVGASRPRGTPDGTERRSQ